MILLDLVYNFVPGILFYSLLPQRRLRREVMVWSRVHHPNILPLLGIRSNFDRPNMPGLVSPYCHHGNITSYLKDRPTVNKLPLVSHNIKSGTEILAHLHLSL
jgi:serine/threonine protein kinase